MKNGVRTLIIDEGSEFKIKVEEINKFNESFFKDIYDSAAVNVKEIIDNTNEYYNKKYEKRFFNDKEEFNNIIAFAGERGTGKSSVMISFAEALKSIHNYNEVLERQEFKELNMLKEVSFINLDIIDPALLEDKESIFEIVIAKMFSKFKEYLEKEDGKLEFDDKKRLLKKFQKVYKDLKIINTDRKDFFKDAAYSEDILQTLVSLASGANMRNSFIELVNEFLEFFSDINGKNKRFLVIPIDDLDMNIKHSAEMAEQIRKYLMVPNVIILMAVKIEQLKDSVEQMYRKNYEVMLEENNLSDDPKEMAERYLEKLIPNGRKLYLPDIRSHKNGREENIELVFKNKNHRERNLYETESKLDNNFVGASIEEIVLKMTYEKTGLIFLKPKYDIHYLVPDNLRELQNYLIMISKMEDISINSNIKTRLENIERFERYFLKTWIKRNLTKENVQLVEEFYFTSIEKKNKFIITKMNKIIFQELKKEFEDKIYESLTKEYDFSKNVTGNKIFDINNNSLNISLGDVLESLNIYDEYDGRETKKLKFSIKVLYSIILSKLLYDSNDYDSASILIGGNVFETKEKGDNMLSQSLKLGTKGTDLYSKAYNVLPINGKNIGVVVRETVKLVKDAIIESKLDSIDSKQNNNVKLLEWIHYFLYVGSENLNDSYRKQYNAYYDRSPNLGMGNIEVKCARFDITAFIFYLLNTEKNLERIFWDYINFLNISDEELKKVDQNQEDKIQVREKIKSKIFEYIKENLSMFNEVNEWKNKYKVAIPIYSVEVIEYIRNNIRKKSENKNQIISYYDNLFKNLILAFKMSLENMLEDNSFLLENNSFDYMNNDIMCAYMECPIIKIIVGSTSLNGSITFNSYDENILRQVINGIYINSSEGATVFKKEVEDLKMKIIEHQKYFTKWSNNPVSNSTIIKRINEILNLKYLIIKTNKLYTKFMEFKTILTDINDSEKEIVEKTLAEINQELNVSIQSCDTSLNAIEKHIIK